MFKRLNHENYQAREIKMVHFDYTNSMKNIFAKFAIDQMVFTSGEDRTLGKRQTSIIF